MQSDFPIFPSHIIYRAHGQPKMTITQNLCAVCGFPYGKIAIKEVIGASFTNHDLLRVPYADMICEACRFTTNTPDFRRTSFICTAENFTPLKRENIADALFLQDLPYTAYLFVITSSYKKHLWLQCTPSLRSHAPCIRFDDYQIVLNIDADRITFDAIELLYSTFSKDEIRHGNYEAYKMNKCDLKVFVEQEKVVSPIRQTAKLDLLLYLANKKEELCQHIQNTAAMTAIKPFQTHEKQLLLF